MTKAEFAGIRRWIMARWPAAKRWTQGQWGALYEDLVILHNSQQADQLEPGEQPGDSCDNELFWSCHFRSPCLPQLDFHRHNMACE